jgi:transposase InsO family protein
MESPMCERSSPAIAGPWRYRPTPAHALTPEERARAPSVANEPRFADRPPARIVPALADEGIYIASESTFGRVLGAKGQNAHRGRAKEPEQQRQQRPMSRTEPGELWCWDMTYLPTEVAGRWFYLYLILDIYSRKIVGWEVHETDDADHAARVVQRAALAEGIAANQTKPVLHGDNGATLKATTVLAMLHWLGIKPSYSRPRVSNDNAFAESAFRTAKYRPEYVRRGFKIWTKPETGPVNSCTGTTSSICTAESATSTQITGMSAKTTRFWLHGITCTSTRKLPIHGAGLTTPGTGRPSAQSTLNPEKPNHQIKINRQSPHNAWDNYLDVAAHLLISAAYMPSGSGSIFSKATLSISRTGRSGRADGTKSSTHGMVNRLGSERI